MKKRVKPATDKNTKEERKASLNVIEVGLERTKRQTHEVFVELDELEVGIGLNIVVINVANGNK